MTALKKIENEIQSFADYFVKRYFESEPSDIYWIAGIKGGVLCINDYFFNFDNMINFVRYKYTANQVFGYYDYALDMSYKKESPICIRDWKKLIKN